MKNSSININKKDTMTYDKMPPNSIIKTQNQNI